jgi:hypothetical protein
MICPVRHAAMIAQPEHMDDVRSKDLFSARGGGMTYTAWKIDIGYWRTICADIRAQISPRILAVDELLTGNEFDPGSDDQQTRDDYLREWRTQRSEPGGYPHCATCHRRERNQNRIDWLPAPISDPDAARTTTVLTVPYYEITSPRTAWSATAYGNIRGATDRNLVDRVLRGEHRMTPAQARESVKRASRMSRRLRPQIDLRIHDRWR